MNGAATAVGAPLLSPAAGTYHTTQNVSIADAVSGASIFYTTTGATPSIRSTPYGGPIAVGSSETIKAIAAADGVQSPVSSAKYTIALPAETPVFAPAAGIHRAPQSVSISDATGGAAIFYTTNGRTPTTASTRYVGPITVSKSATLKAVALAAGGSESPVASAKYTVR